MQYKFVKYNTKSRIAYIVLNRPDKRNALNGEFVEELKNAFTRAENDDKAKVIILKAAGRAFCAGADLSYLQKLQKNTFEENLEDSQNLMQLYKQIYTLKKIVIAQIEGHAIAGGAGLATVCDFSFAVPEARFGYTEVAIGFVPAIVSIFLIRKIGETKAKELLLTGKIISCKKAVKKKILNFTEEPDEISSRVKNFARKLIDESSADSLALTKKLIATVQNNDYDSALNFASKINAKARETKDCKQGISAFLNKEKIKW